MISDFKSRRGRVLDNGVSYAPNWLLRTPDADDAQFFYDSIRTFLNND